MTTATFMDLPQELLDMIVDCGPDHGSDGDGDGDGLQFYADCALVCRSLRGRSQYHLYFEVELYSSERIDGLLDIIRNDPLIAWYIRRINTTSQQLIEDYGLDVPLATLLLLIKEHSPQSSLAMTIMGHTGDMFEHDSSPERHLSPEGLVSCLSQVHYLKVKEVEEFPSVILFSFKHLSALCLIKTTFDPELHVIEQRQILQLAAPILRSVTGLELCNIEFFPGVLLSNFETLTTLNLKNVRFAEAAVDLESPRPRPVWVPLNGSEEGGCRFGGPRLEGDCCMVCICWVRCLAWGAGTETRALCSFNGFSNLFLRMCSSVVLFAFPNRKRLRGIQSW